MSDLEGPLKISTFEDEQKPKSRHQESAATDWMTFANRVNRHELHIVYAIGIATHRERAKIVPISSIESLFDQSP